ncbi:MAG: hypothetical protein HKN04_00480 [Rhodothermaceae bacterium]|nr:hypothetical protein [Rhodothermaceae bacterium]
MTPRLAFLLALLLGQAGCLAAQDRPDASWEHIEGGEDTDCALGTPYRFFYRPGADASRLLIYFQGGGACWDWVSCSGMFDTSVERMELAEYRGIFDGANPANPFRDFATLFVPYCTGDVHVGDAERRYGDDASARPVTHAGARNVEYALQWIHARTDAPRQIVIAGASAGAYGAVFHAPRIAVLYPAATLITIADSGVPLLPGYEAILDQWGAGPTLRSAWSVGPEVSLTLHRAYREAADASGMRAVVQITSDQDAIQSAFYLIAGSPAWRDDSYALLNRLEREVPTIHSFVVAGSDHGLMRTDAFYDYEASGTALEAWIDRLINEEPVTSVRCEACTAP